MKLLWFFFLFPFIGFSQPEKIDDFSVVIEIDKNGEFIITETIEIYAKGDVFKHGLVRVLPNLADNIGQQFMYSFYDLISVKQDGREAKYHTKHRKGDLLIYIGDKSSLLDKNRNYSYELKYKVSSQLLFFEEFDELYWNVIGHEWQVAIDQVSAKVFLPTGADAIKNICYTGEYGEDNSSNCIVKVSDREVLFTTNSVGNGKGFTISSSFIKGVVSNSKAPPLNFKGLRITLVFGCILLFYYVFTWFQFGIDSPKPTIVPQFDAPDSLSPASVGFIYKEKYSTQLLAASIINLAIKGFIDIEEIKHKKMGLLKDNQYKLTQLKTSIDNLCREEKAIFQRLFKTRKEVIINGSYDEEISIMVTSFERSLDNQWGLLLRKGKNTFLIVIPFVILFIYSFVYLIPLSNSILLWIFFLVINVIITLFPYRLLIRKPESKKQQLQAKIEGLKMYLSAAEENELQQFNPPEMTPKIFEKFLPYAMVLGIDKIWGDKFSKKLNILDSKRYSQSGYLKLDVGQFNSFSHSMSSSLSKSSKGYSSRFGGSVSGSSGGFSGGGKGGGGGGGW